MNCKKCGHPLNGATVCPNCGTSIGYVVNDASGISVGPVDNNNNGYFQNTVQSSFKHKNKFIQTDDPSDFGFDISEPSDSAFNKDYEIENEEESEDVVEKMAKLFKKSGSGFNKRKTMQNEANNSVENATGAPILVNFTTTNYSGDNDDIGDDVAALLTRDGILSKDKLVEQIEKNNTVDNFTKKKDSDGWSMDLPEDKKTNRIWLVVGTLILLIIIVGIYILPLFTDVEYSRYEEENFIIKYNKDWVSQVELDTKKINFLYKDTGYKIIINEVSTFSELNFEINTLDDRSVLYNAYYDSWKNIIGGKLVGGTNTFIDLGKDNSMYAKFDYELDGKQSGGSFYVIVCEKYDLIITLMTFCSLKDRNEFEKLVMDFINGIDYVGPTVKEKEQQEYQEFQAQDIKEYKAGALIDYRVPNNAWTLDVSRTQSINNQYNIFKFKDEKSLLEVKAYQGYYTYESMKASAVSNFGALKKEDKITVNGKVWYALTTPDYDANGYSYHNEIYFTMSTNNNYIYFVQAYVFNETSIDSVKRMYFEDSLKFIFENMTLNNVNS